MGALYPDLYARHAEDTSHPVGAQRVMALRTREEARGVCTLIALFFLRGKSQGDQAEALRIPDSRQTRR